MGLSDSNASAEAHARCILTFHIDVSECFRLGSEQGEELLSFFLEPDVRHLDPALKAEIVEYIRELSYEKNGRRYLYHPVAVFMLGRGVGESC